jgi:hypothetical protein
LKAADVLLQNQEVLGRFVVQNDTFGAEAVTECVWRGTVLSGWSGWPFREGAVGFRRLNSSQ